PRRRARIDDAARVARRGRVAFAPRGRRLRGRRVLRLVRPASVRRRRGHDMGRARGALIAAAAALVLPASAAANITGTPAVRAVFALERNGVLDVVERLNVTADAPTPATWQITMQRGELFAQPSLYVDRRRYRPGDPKRPGKFKISRGSRG